MQWIHQGSKLSDHEGSILAIALIQYLHALSRLYRSYSETKSGKGIYYQGKNSNIPLFIGLVDFEGKVLSDHMQQS